MNRRRNLVLVASMLVVMVAASVLAGVALSRSGTALSMKKPTPHALSLKQAASVTFPIYYAGDKADGHPLNITLSGFNNSASNDVDFIYGDCTPEPQSGCAPPIEIQVWPACARNLSMYSESVPGGFQPTTVRGVAGAFLDEGRRLELQTGNVTVVIFATSHDQALRVASALRGLNRALAAGQRLPPPVAGALSGGATCPAASSAG
jgi:hypothetical protein